jgi:RNA polymerase sigma-70 factor (ECF subfamily)
MTRGSGVCNDVGGFAQLVSVSGVRHSVGSIRSTAVASDESGAAAEFEVYYRANVGVVTAFFARRCSEPQLVADLTSEVFLQALASLDTYDCDRGGARAWLFGIVRRVWAQHCERAARGREAITALAAHRQLGDDEIEDVAMRIDAQRTARDLLAGWDGLSDLDRAALELVDLTGLEPREAASVLGISAGTLRVRLFRARKRLANNRRTDEQL